MEMESEPYKELSNCLPLTGSLPGKLINGSTVKEFRKVFNYKINSIYKPILTEKKQWKA